MGIVQLIGQTLLIALFKLLLDSAEGKVWYKSIISKVWYESTDVKALGILHMAHHAKSMSTPLNCGMMHLFFSFVMKLVLFIYLFTFQYYFLNCILCNRSLKDMNSVFWIDVLQLHIQSKEGVFRISKLY